MAHIGIVGSGVAGLQLALALQQHGIQSTIYSERTPDEYRARQLSNMVARNACTRERERQLGVNHWDDPHYDMGRLNVCVRGQRTIAFSGRMPPAQAVDLRIYWARLLEDFASRGGRVVMHTVQIDELDDLASRHDLLVVASGRASLSTVFPRVAEHSPYTSPQRLVIGGLFRGIGYSDPRALEVVVNPGHGEILAVPFQSFEPELTGIGILISAGGQFERLRHLRYHEEPRRFVAAILDLLREFAPPVYERVDARAFDLSRPQDLGYAAITPTVRRGFIELSNGRFMLALGDAHVLIDPLTGQGSNNASHAADALCRAIGSGAAFDRAFCERVEQEICAYVVPVSDACNSRLQPPAPHFRELLGAAVRDQSLADLYADGYVHPDRFWAIASSPERTAALLVERGHRPPAAGV
jgi:2-polyprenyl-6-methoxyphenol hydroxylase-like FAD-dependent oxidoreductase